MFYTNKIKSITNSNLQIAYKNSLVIFHRNGVKEKGRLTLDERGKSSGISKKVRRYTVCMFSILNFST